MNITLWSGKKLQEPQSKEEGKVKITGRELIEEMKDDDKDQEVRRKFNRLTSHHLNINHQFLFLKVQKG